MVFVSRRLRRFSQINYLHTFICENLRNLREMYRQLLIYHRTTRQHHFDFFLNCIEEFICIFLPQCQ